MTPVPFLDAAAGRPSSRTPVWFMRQAGRSLPEYRARRGPGSILEARLDNTHPLAWGMPERALVYFERSAAFTLETDSNIERVAWYDSDRPLRSGWAWGQNYLDQGVAMAEGTYGQGTIYMFGPEITFRGQSHGTFRFLFNGVLTARAESVSGVR